METTKIVSSRQQLTMTGVAGAEEIEDGLATPHRPLSRAQVTGRAEFST